MGIGIMLCPVEYLYFGGFWQKAESRKQKAESRKQKAEIKKSVKAESRMRDLPKEAKKFTE